MSRFNEYLEMLYNEEEVLNSGILAKLKKVYAKNPGIFADQDTTDTNRIKTIIKNSDNDVLDIISDINKNSETHEVLPSNYKKLASKYKYAFLMEADDGWNAFYFSNYQLNKISSDYMVLSKSELDNYYDNDND